MDEVFGEENFVAVFAWKKSYGGGSKANYLVGAHEYMLLYARLFEDLAHFELPPSKSVLKYFKFQDSRFDERGPYRLQPPAWMRGLISDIRFPTRVRKFGRRNNGNGLRSERLQGSVVHHSSTARILVSLSRATSYS